MKRTYNNIKFLDPSLYLDYYAGPLEIFMATRIDVWFLFAESFDHESIHSADNEDVVLQSELEKLSTEIEKDEERSTQQKCSLETKEDKTEKQCFSVCLKSPSKRKLGTEKDTLVSPSPTKSKERNSSEICNDVICEISCI